MIAPDIYHSRLLLFMLTNGKTEKSLALTLLGTVYIHRFNAERVAKVFFNEGVTAAATTAVPFQFLTCMDNAMLKQSGRWLAFGENDD